MSRSALFACDAIAICALAFLVYFPRHRRKDMVVAYLAINFGVVGVAQALDGATVTGGLGLGLFGVLSIIRLRSTELDHIEVAYYFAALALGILGGLKVDPAWLSVAMMAALVMVVFIGDHPALFGSYRSHTMTLDRAYTDETELRARLAELLGGKIHGALVRKVDIVQDTTVVDVRYSLPASRPAAETLSSPRHQS